MNEERLEELVETFGENIRQLLEEHGELLENVTTEQFNELQTIAIRYSEDFHDALENFCLALTKGEYGTPAEILALYDEDKRHLEYMAGDPHDIFLENLENVDQNLYRFVLDNNYLDEDNMKDNRADLDETQLMDFNRAIGADEEDVEEGGNASEEDHGVGAIGLNDHGDEGE
jgi:hypothetical protein